ncbi:conjugal transfer protein TraF [Escherichia coli]
MASINTIVKRKQYLWLGIVVVGTASAIGGALYLSDVDMSGNGETVAEQEPVPDMTGVVDTTFDDKVRQHATTEMQVTAAQMQKQYEEIRRELDVLNKQRGDDQRRIEKLGQDNAALAEQVKALGANPVTATGEPVRNQLAADQAQQRQAIAKLAEHYGIMFFYRGQDPIDGQLAQVINGFRDTYGLSVIPVSVDGVINPLLPDSRTDQGQAQRLGVKYFPAMMLVDPKQGSIRPLSYGFISQDDLAKQFLNVSEDFKPNF